MGVAWIKITTNIFDDDKIKLIDSMPDRDSMLVIWIKLLTLAGRSNSNGCLMVSEYMAYTDEMLSAVFARPLNTVRFALETFVKLGMIEKNEKISIVNWEKHQNADAMETIRQYDATRKRLQRQKLALPSPNVPTNVRDMSGTNAGTIRTVELELDKELDKEIYCPAEAERFEDDPIPNTPEKKADKYPWQDILSYLNTKTGSRFQSIKKTQTLINSIFTAGYTHDDFIKVIDFKTSQWLNDPKMCEYLRPSTLFTLSNFDEYLNASPKKKSEPLIQNKEKCPDCDEIRLPGETVCPKCHHDFVNGGKFIREELPDGFLLSGIKGK